MNAWLSEYAPQQQATQSVITIDNYGTVRRSMMVLL